MRVLFSAPIRVSGQDSKNRDFNEETRTLVVNAHGAFISLAADVMADQHTLWFPDRSSVTFVGWCDQRVQEKQRRTRVPPIYSARTTPTLDFTYSPHNL